MKTPLSTYSNAGGRAGRASRRGDVFLVSSLGNWRQLALAQESPANRIAASGAYWEAYKAEATPVPSPFR